MLEFQKSFMSSGDDKSVTLGGFQKGSTKWHRTICSQRSISTKPSLPWITQGIKRTMRKRDSLYDKDKKHRRPADRQVHLEFNIWSIKKLKEAYSRYINDLLGIRTPIDPNDSNANYQTLTDSNTNNLATKKLYSLLTNSKMDSNGLVPLERNGQLHTNTTEKAKILNQQFQSVFTP